MAGVRNLDIHRIFRRGAQQLQTYANDLHLEDVGRQSGGIRQAELQTSAGRELLNRGGVRDENRHQGMHDIKARYLARVQLVVDIFGRRHVTGQERENRTVFTSADGGV